MDSTSYTLNGVLLKVDNVHFQIQTTSILRGVQAEINDIVRPGCVTGQVVGFLGPSGAGKTTLLRIMAGLLPPTAGQVLVRNGNGLIPVHQGLVGVVAQNYPLFEHRTVFGNLLLAARQHLAPTSTPQENVESMLTRFGLAERATAYPAQLSGGQRQRVAIAQQLLCGAQFLLMDEPFSGLDPLAKQNVCHLIAEVANANELCTIIVVSHDIGSATAISDHLWLLGRDHSADGRPIPGARIQQVYDLIERDLCWHPEIQQTETFSTFVREVTDRFRTL